MYGSPISRVLPLPAAVLLAALLLVPAPSAVRSLSCADRLGDLGVVNAAASATLAGPCGRAVPPLGGERFGGSSRVRGAARAWGGTTTHGTVHVEQIGRGPAFTG